MPQEVLRLPEGRAWEGLFSKDLDKAATLPSLGSRSCFWPIPSSFLKPPGVGSQDPVLTPSSSAPPPSTGWPSLSYSLSLLLCHRNSHQTPETFPGDYSEMTCANLYVCLFSGKWLGSKTQGPDFGFLHPVSCCNKADLHSICIKPVGAFSLINFS